MPELPEVETIRRGLSKVIVGRKITKFESRDAKVVRFDQKDITGLFISNIERRAKILMFHLSNVIPAKAGIQKNTILDPRVKPEDDKGSSEKLLLCHLKMTGQLIWEACPGETEFCLKKSRIAGGHPSPDWVAKLPNKHTRAIFSFDDKSVLFFNDVRRFGYLKLYKKAELGSISELKKLGPEPLGAEFKNQKSKIKMTIQKSKKPIKLLLLDQNFISGIGNIYADETLFEAGVLPSRKGETLSDIEINNIFKAIPVVLNRGIKYGGSSEDTYVDAFGNQGTMDQHTKVYRKKGQPCDKCGTKVERIVLGGRATHFCPACQR